MRPARTAGSQGGNEQQGLETGFEQKAGRKRLDVLAHVDRLRVVLEGLTGLHTKAQAIKDADADCPDAGAAGAWSRRLSPKRELRLTWPYSESWLTAGCGSPRPPP